MNTPRQFYNSQIDTHTETLKKVKKQLALSSMVRLFVFLTIIIVGYFGYPNAQILIGSIIIGAILFLVLVNRHSKLSYKKKKLQKLVEINQLEIYVSDGKLDTLPTGTEFINTTHEYSHDIDLFGEKSMFQFMNRTTTLAGKNLFASLLQSNDIQNIENKQDAIKNLADLPQWRQEFSATATLVKVSLPVPTILNWLRNFSPFVPKKMGAILPVFSSLSVLMIGLLFFEIISFSNFLLWFFLGLGIIGIHLKKINKLYYDANKVKDTFEQYYKLVDLIEQTSFTAPYLKEIQQKIITDTEKASVTLKKFAKILDAFDQRNNMMYGIFGNGLLLWDLLQSYRVEKWIHQNGNRIEEWFDVIAIFDAYSTMGNFAFNHPGYTYPNLTSSQTIIQAEGLGHPMLRPEKRVDNDITIQKEQFFIITGANMAGKSTFLRTIALHIVMANMGLPICARSCRYTPIKLITSMRTSDSLSDDASYFFSELTQLKRIIDILEKDDYFIILDEILKGTNSKDKAAGSRKFVEKLVAAKATGIIATHDLSLCEIASKLDKVLNKYFDAQIVNDELYFDYTFKEGICQNMNASFLLNKMGIV